jgi:hypothetical protein
MTVKYFSIRVYGTLVGDGQYFHHTEISLCLHSPYWNFTAKHFPVWPLQTFGNFQTLCNHVVFTFVKMFLILSISTSEAFDLCNTFQISCLLQCHVPFQYQ